MEYTFSYLFNFNFSSSISANVIPITIILLHLPFISNLDFRITFKEIFIILHYSSLSSSSISVSIIKIVLISLNTHAPDLLEKKNEKLEEENFNSIQIYFHFFFINYKFIRIFPNLINGIASFCFAFSDRLFCPPSS